MSQIDWSGLRAAVKTVPKDEQQYFFLLRRIKGLKQSLEWLAGWRRLAVELSSRETCQKHWLKNCYSCRVDYIDKQIKVAKKRLAAARFYLIALAIKYGFASARPTAAKAAPPMERPKDVIDYGARHDNAFWDSASANFRTAPRTAQDLQAQVSLLRSYIENRFSASEG